MLCLKRERYRANSQWHCLSERPLFLRSIGKDNSRRTQ